MRLKLKTICAAALLVSGAAAHAQSSVTLYGIIDTGVEYLTNATPQGGSVTRMSQLTGGDLPSRWGLTGKEDLGGGLAAVFTLENGFNASTGAAAQGGRLFGRQAYVGLSGDWGTLTFGRNQNLFYYAMPVADVIGPSEFSMADFDPYIASARDDNSVSYRATYRGVSVGATYSFGRDTLAPGNCGGQVPGDFSACRAITASLGYDHGGDWGLVGVWDEQRGGSENATMTVIPGQPGIPFTSSGDRDTRIMVNGYVKVYDVRLAGGWIHRNISAQAGGLTTNLYFVGAHYNVTPTIILDAQYVAFRNPHQDANGDLAILRGNYLFSKRTMVYLMVGEMLNHGNATYSVSDTTAVPAAPAPGRNQFGVIAGIQQSF